MQLRDVTAAVPSPGAQELHAVVLGPGNEVTDREAVGRQGLWTGPGALAAATGHVGLGDLDEGFDVVGTRRFNCSHAKCLIREVDQGEGVTGADKGHSGLNLALIIVSVNYNPRERLECQSVQDHLPFLLGVSRPPSCTPQ